MLIFLPK